VTRFARVGAPALLVLAEVAAVAALHALGGVEGLGGPGTDPAGWLGSATPEEVVGGCLRLVALGCAWWLLGSTLLYATAAASRLPAVAAHAIGRSTLPGIRVLVDRAAAASLLAAATLGAPASPAAGTGEPPSDVRDGRAVETLSPAPQPPAPPPAPPPPTAPVEPAGTHVVVSGDNLWSIAAAHVAGVIGTGLPGDGQVGPYWVRVVESNRPRLRSGDPDLVYPGEVVELPPFPA
jgi:hypothetical protein